jgi:hypothetical protein
VLLGLLPTGAIDQNVAHRLRGSRVKVMRALPLRLSLRSNQPDVGLMNEPSRIERLAGRLATETIGGELPQFVVDERE